jgi:predicted anti-sigma-YlaC factor YlaD
MKEHFENWLDAYLDGELMDIQIVAYENHLNECESCRKAYEGQLLLKQALSSVQPIQGNKDADQFLAEIRLQMPSSRSKRIGIHRIIWYLVPSVLILFFGVMQTYAWLTGLIELIPGANRLIVGSLPFLSEPVQVNPWLTTVVKTGMFWNGLDWLFDWNIFTQLILAISASVVYFVWMALWMMNIKSKTNSIEI